MRRMVMANKILIINGSPRKNGNTSVAVQWAMEGANLKDVAVDTISLSLMENTVNGCIGCRSCQNSKEYRCFINDDTSKALYVMTDYDVIVFAMPVYFGTIPAQMKSFMDRMYSHLKIKNGVHTLNPLFENKTFAVIATAGAGYNNGLSTLEEYMKEFTSEFSTSLYQLSIPWCNANPSVLRENNEHKEKARVFGEKLAEI
jgi:multimeric flavodoxin WrbA